MAKYERAANGWLLLEKVPSMRESQGKGKLGGAATLNQSQVSFGVDIYMLLHSQTFT